MTYVWKDRDGKQKKIFHNFRDLCNGVRDATVLLDTIAVFEDHSEDYVFDDPEITFIKTMNLGWQIMDLTEASAL